MQSLILTGGTEEERLTKGHELLTIKYKVSRFDLSVLEKGEKDSIGIEQIRELEHNLNLKPYNSPNKGAIIHPGEILTVEAQNALLKTLEEAAESSIIILTAPQTEMLLPTVVSRCQIIKLPSKPELEMDEKSLTTYYSLFNTILKGGVGERLKFASQLGKEREEIKNWLEKMIYFWREILIKKEGFQDLTNSQIIKIIKNLQKTRDLVGQNINPRLAMEIFLLDLPSLP